MRVMSGSEGASAHHNESKTKNSKKYAKREYTPANKSENAKSGWPINCSHVLSFIQFFFAVQCNPSKTKNNVVALIDSFDHRNSVWKPSVNKTESILTSRTFGKSLGPVPFGDKFTSKWLWNIIKIKWCKNRFQLDQSNKADLESTLDTFG